MNNKMWKNIETGEIKSREEWSALYCAGKLTKVTDPFSTWARRKFYVVKIFKNGNIKEIECV